MKHRTTNRNAVMIDRDKLKREFAKRGILANDVSRELGYGRNYLSSAMGIGKLRESVVVLLDRLYGIKRESYEITEEAEAEQQECVINQVLTLTDAGWAKLKAVIVEAIKEVQG